MKKITKTEEYTWNHNHSENGDAKANNIVKIRKSWKNKHETIKEIFQKKKIKKKKKKKKKKWKKRHGNIY